MGKNVFPFAVFEAQLHAAGLVVGEARTARYFEIFAMPRGPDFDVVGFCRAKTDVARAKLDGAIVQAELLQNALSVGGEFLKLCEAVVGMDDLHKLDFMNWCMRMMPLLSRPAEPASRRKHGV